MAASVEIKYFNTFILKKTNNDDEPIWNGSFGIPQDLGGYPVVSPLTGGNNWAIEESRIRGGYNNTTVDFGVKAYIVDESNSGNYRKSSLIYSGIFNSRTGINQTNVFSIGEDITKTADPSNASIQRLYAEDTNLVIFQENKVSRALIDKDAIYAAEGGGTVTSSNLVIGVIQPFAGEYGISKNPESFAVYGYRKYFSDANNNAILRLSRSGIDEISSYGMRDYFRDEINTIGSSGKIIGGYDIYNDQYVVSTQITDGRGGRTIPTSVSFDEQAKGWVSFFSFKPDQVFSLKNKFYTVKDGGIWQQYSNNVNRGNFYGVDYTSEVSVIFNPNPDRSKTFKTVSYEGANGWMVKSLFSDETGVDSQPNLATISNIDQSSQIYSYYEGEYVSAITTLTTANTVTGNTVLINTTNAIPVNSSVTSSSIVIPANTVVTNQTTVSGVVSQDTQTNTVTITNCPFPVPVGTQITATVAPFGTTVVSYDPITGVLVVSAAISAATGSLITFVGLAAVTLNNPASFVINQSITFSVIANRADYLTVFSTQYPAYDKQRAGFCRKENSYVANIVNNSAGAAGEIIYGDSMMGIKGFYAVTTFSTDTTTDVGGEKQLFMVSSEFTGNNGY
tara:strand:- start:1544 stop:3403 length:1860 start_codon:yes stop_codon:yes gene_type:complete